MLRSERYFGQVARSFALPADVDASQAKAKYDNGVLTLTLPKKQASNAQRLHIDRVTEGFSPPCRWPSGAARGRPAQRQRQSG